MPVLIGAIIVGCLIACVIGAGIDRRHRRRQLVPAYVPRPVVILHDDPEGLWQVMRTW